MTLCQRQYRVVVQILAFLLYHLTSVCLSLPNFKVKMLMITTALG